jgi:hypothetical protein
VALGALAGLRASTVIRAEFLPAEVRRMAGYYRGRGDAELAAEIEAAVLPRRE